MRRGYRVGPVIDEGQGPRPQLEDAHRTPTVTDGIGVALTLDACLAEGHATQPLGQMGEALHVEKAQGQVRVEATLYGPLKEVALVMVVVADAARWAADAVVMDVVVMPGASSLGDAEHNDEGERCRCHA